MDWSWIAWTISIAAVVISGGLAWLEGNWTRRPGLGIGFSNHGGMWGDLVLLPMANAVIVPHLSGGWWTALALVPSAAASIAAHIHWYHPAGGGDSPAIVEPSADGEMIADAERATGDHMWPTRRHGAWWRDLSWSGWAHVVYVIGELMLLAGFLVHDLPADVVLFVSVIFTIHVPIGLLQPRWFLTGHIATVTEQPLLAPLLLALWAVTLVKL